jgi:hypothetical protein
VDLRVILFEPFFQAINAPQSTCPNLGGNIPIRMPYVKYEGKSTVCNTGWLGIHIKRTLPKIFHTYGMKSAPMDASGASQMNWASTW